MTVRRHLVILLVLTLLIRGVMFISYPMGGQGEFQGFHRYLVAKLLSGDLMIGNLRYSPGYPLFIAPFAALGELFGRFDERVVLLVQIALSSSIPFFLYDIIKTRHSPKAAFLIGLLSLVDPFGLQWAHFSLPVWMVATCMVFSLWFLHHALLRRSWTLVIAAGFVAGLGVLGRWNFAPLVAGMGLLPLFTCIGTISVRILYSLLYGCTSFLLVLFVHVALQVPTTGVWSISCISGISLVESLETTGLKIQAKNGPNSDLMLRLGSLPPLPENAVDLGFGEGGRYFRLFFADSFPNWVIPGSWSTAAEREKFIRQDNEEPYNSLAKSSTYLWLYYYLGPCETDRILRGAYFETIMASPVSWFFGIPNKMLDLLRPPLTMAQEYPYYSVPRADSIQYKRADGVLGFERAEKQIFSFYQGHWVWRPGIEIFTRLWMPLNALRFLVLPALIWAFFTRQRVYTVPAVLLLLYVSVMAVVDSPEQRIYAIVYPLGPVLVGAFLMTCKERLFGRTIR